MLKINGLEILPILSLKEKISKCCSFEIAILLKKKLDRPNRRKISAI